VPTTVGLLPYPAATSPHVAALPLSSVWSTIWLLGADVRAGVTDDPNGAGVDAAECADVDHPACLRPREHTSTTSTTPAPAT
jgi:hypothetical protein